MTPLTITRTDGNGMTGEGFLVTWMEEDKECRGVYEELDEAFEALLYHFEGRYPTNKTERDYYGKVTVERGPV